MLLRLSIRNVILVREAILSFDKQFNVLTGETGSGKSVVLSAIGLLMGDRADSDLVRLGEDKAIIEGHFCARKIKFDADSDLLKLLSEYSLEDIFDTNEFSIRREITHLGKSKAFINNVLVPLQVIKKLSEQMIELSLQHAHMAIKDDSFALSMIDNMDPLIPPLRLEFSQQYSRYLEVIAKREQLLLDVEKKEIELEKIHAHISIIEESEILHTDVEALFKEYSRLESQKGIFETYNTALDMLDGFSRKSTPIELIKTLHQFLEHSSDKESEEKLSPLIKHIHSALAELIEASFLIKKMISSSEYDEHTLNRHEKMLSKIAKVEKLFGTDKESIQHTLDSLKERERFFTSIEIEKEYLDVEIAALFESLTLMEEELHKMRLTSAQSIELLIQNELHQLNMESCQFEIVVSRKKNRSKDGISTATLYITPNKGEKRIELAQHASGGEMARVFLAIQTVLSSQEKIPTIIFDEVDANIGGVTASHVGKKLSQIGKYRQVIAITHFPQVAEEATCHFTIRKMEEEGRTYTLIEMLQSEEKKQQEKLRMVGGS